MVRQRQSVTGIFKKVTLMNAANTLLTAGLFLGLVTPVLAQDQTPPPPPSQNQAAPQSQDQGYPPSQDQEPPPPPSRNQGRPGRNQAPPPEQKVAPISAGGKWLEFDSKDPMTDVKRARFQLEGDNPLRDSERNPKINIFCESGNYVFGHFVPGVRVRPDHPSFWGRPQVEVRVRADSNLDHHGWNWNGRFLDMDKDSVRRLTGATAFKIQLPGPDSPDNIATFSPAGLNLTQFENACHLKPKK